MQRCSCNMISGLGKYHNYYYYYFILCRDVLITCQVVQGNIIIIIIIIIIIVIIIVSINFVLCPLMTSFGCLLLPYVCNRF